MIQEDIHTEDGVKKKWVPKFQTYYRVQKEKLAEIKHEF